MFCKFLCVYATFHGTWCSCFCFYVLGLDSCIVVSEFFLIAKEGFEITKNLGFIPNPQINLNLFTLELVHNKLHNKLD